ncbi:MAG: RNA polymerase sigma factor (sigma-70 family) [Planctomycetota bacterium]|jgi:RNA polymerase sigma factor (sigma-70 family)
MADASRDLDPDRLASLLQEFASQRLGPHSCTWLSGPEASANTLASLAEGLDLEDAALKEIHQGANQSPELADEFLRYFLGDLLNIGRSTLSDGLHRFVDTSDLVQSVIGDIWPILGDAKFQTRGQFLSFLSRRLDWKAVGKARKLRGERDHREDESTPISEPATGAPTPLTELASDEDYDATILKIMRLSERDQRIITLHIQEQPIDVIAAEFEMTRATAYKAVQRAVERFRALQ